MCLSFIDKINLIAINRVVVPLLFVDRLASRVELVILPILIDKILIIVARSLVHTYIV